MRNVREILGIEYDKYDPWGFAVDLGFAVAGVMDAANLDIPEEWEYEVSPLLADRTIEDIISGVEYDSSAEYDIATLYANAEVTPTELRYIGNVAVRLAEFLELKGRSY